jgi:hypothetical protein
VASNKVVLPLLLWCSFRRLPNSSRPCHQCGIPALPSALLPAAAHLWLTAPPVPPATFARAYRTATETPLGQKNYQKWCLNPGSMDLCNFSPFQCCTCTTLLPKRHIRHSESRSEEITAVQASTRLHVRPEGSVSLQARLMRSHTPPWCGTLLHTLVSRSHVLPHALDLLAREFHASMRLLAREMHVPMQTAGFWRVHTRARHSSNPTR